MSSFSTAPWFWRVTTHYYTHGDSVSWTTSDGSISKNGRRLQCQQQNKQIYPATAPEAACTWVNNSSPCRIYFRRTTAVANRHTDSALRISKCDTRTVFKLNSLIYVYFEHLRCRRSRTVYSHIAGVVCSFFNTAMNLTLYSLNGSLLSGSWITMIFFRCCSIHFTYNCFATARRMFQPNNQNTFYYCFSYSFI